MDQPSMTAANNDTASRGMDVASRTFSASFRGFDRNEVRRFLAELADQQRALIARASEAESRMEDLRGRLESVEGLLQSADEKYQAAQARLEEMENERPVAEVQQQADPEQDAVKIFGEKVTEVLQIAVAAGNSIRAEAEAWATQRRQEADDLAASTLASARQEVADIVAREQTNVEQLRTTEEALRSWLQAAHSAIGRVLEQPVVDPAALASVMDGIHELGPSRESFTVEERVEVWVPVATDQDQAFIPMPTVLSSYEG
jgi:DivIVA domain-containing protein